MEEIANKSNLKHEYLYEGEALMLSSLAATPIFSPVHKKNAKNKELVEFELFRTKNERVVFNGPRLDLQRDYPLFHIIMRKKQVTGLKNFDISEYEMMKSLGIQNRTSNKKDVESRIKKMMACFFEIEKYSNDGELVCKIYSNLINRVKWNVKDKVFHIEISEDLFNAEQKLDYEVLKLDLFSGFKSQYARALFLFYETFKFINQESVDFPMEKLGIRLGKNNMQPKYVNQEIKKANAELIEKKYIRKVDYFKAKSKANMCKIYR